MTRWIVVYLLLLPFCIYGGERIIPTVEVAPDPSTMVHGCVNVLTGTFSDADTPLCFPGPTSYAFQYRYNSGDEHSGSLTGGWSHNIQLCCALTVGQDCHWCIETRDDAGMGKFYRSGIVRVTKKIY